MDFAKELEKYPDASPEEKKELEQLAGMQKDVAIGNSAEDFIRHPFFKMLENKMNDMINDSKGKLFEIETLEELQAHKASIKSIVDLKAWLNSYVMKGRIGRQAIEMYEKETDELNYKVQELIDKANEEK
jgi:uncharacterized protein YjgD (DUF1641 family)